MVHKV
jgi:hypothetical protein